MYYDFLLKGVFDLTFYLWQGELVWGIPFKLPPSFAKINMEFSTSVSLLSQIVCLFAIFCGNFAGTFE